MTIRLRCLLPMVAALLAACITNPALERATAGAGPSAAVPETAAQGGEAATAGGGEAQPAAARELGGIVELLEDGRYREGHAALVAYLQREPGSSLAKGLLQQLDADPVALLGKAHRAYVVQPGDTLGGLAARHLGDASRFVALARYNGIARPKSLRAGQTLKLPAGRTGVPSAPPAPEEAPAKGQRQRNEAELAAGREDTDTALQQQQRGLVLMREGKREAAYEAFGRALAQSPALEPARRHRAELARKLVTGYHKAAVVHFRNQRLDEAIVLWDKALAIDPGFEPAQGYRTRALELKRRLKALESS